MAKVLQDCKKNQAAPKKTKTTSNNYVYFLQFISLIYTILCHTHCKTSHPVKIEVYIPCASCKTWTQTFCSGVSPPNPTDTSLANTGLDEAVEVLSIWSLCELDSDII